MREAFSDALVKLAINDHRVLLLTGDHGYALFDEFRKACPKQYVNAGIAEQNMVGMAAGLAKSGYIPFVYGLAAFIPIRVLEQIKMDIAHDNLHVILLGDGAGFVYSHLGTSHQSMEDIAVARSIPNLTVLSPADRFEQTLCMDWAYNAKSPVYMRMGKSDRGDVHNGPLQTNIGNPIQLRTGSPGGISVIATGSMVKTAIDLYDSNLVDADIWSVPTIKPINARVVQDICSKSIGVVTIEEHTKTGGLGSLIAEISSQYYPVRMLRIGVRDRFSEYCGSYEYLLQEHNLDIKSVENEINQFSEILNQDKSR